MKTINLSNGQPQRGPLIRWHIAIWFLAVPFVLTLLGAVVSAWAATRQAPQSGPIILVATSTPQPAPTRRCR